MALLATYIRETKLVAEPAAFLGLLLVLYLAEGVGVSGVLVDVALVVVLLPQPPVHPRGHSPALQILHVLRTRVHWTDRLLNI